MPDEMIDHPAHYGGDDLYEAIKRCSHCEEDKPLESFPTDNRRKDGRGSKCRDCTRAIRRDYYARYPEKEAERRMKQQEHGANWYRRNRETQVERMRWNHTMRKYGVDRQRYFDLLAEQGGLCAICGSEDPGRDNGYFLIDHCHATDEVRGLLCHPCNVGIGMLRDDPEVMRAAAEYIERSVDV